VRFTGKPAATRNADGRLEVFVRGADGTARHVWQTSAGGDWSGGGAPGWRISGDPAVARFDVGARSRIELFAAGTSGRLLHAWQTSPSGGWAATDDFGRGFADGSPVAVCESNNGGIHVYGRNPSGAVLERRLLPGQPWTEVRNLGGIVAGGPAAAVNADDRPEVVARGADGRLVHRWGPF
jgi:hypothetical protein